MMLMFIDLNISAAILKNTRRTKVVHKTTFYDWKWIIFI